MPIGPRGEKRPAGHNAAAIMVAKIATGEMSEQYANDRPWTDDEVLMRAVASKEKVSAARKSKPEA
ncbi:MAG: hypothetical protein OXE76_11225 [Alphaproteobacteria bacterium]|nr:hypothetical protein [Alphaproteobacteria bacterium]